MTTPAPIAETFGSKFRQMEQDLRSIVHRANIDKSDDLAEYAIKAIRAVDALKDRWRGALGLDLPWDWKPEPPDDEDED